jgi:2-deoxy-scyllo-inosamine dehydrogenase (SAM-dependent)
VEEPVILPTRTAKGIIETLGLFGYAGRLAFHQYNEPLEDPRLYYLVQYVREKCLDAQMYIVTNGEKLTRDILDDLRGWGVKVIVTPYKPKVKERIAPWEEAGRLTTVKPSLDSRLEIYSTPYRDMRLPCYAPYGHMVFTCTGEVGLCCMDYRYENTFGPAERFVSVMCGDKMNGVYQALRKGDRGVLDICRRCKWAR